jgi:hypothetical protein
MSGSMRSVSGIVGLFLLSASALFACATFVGFTSIPCTPSTNGKCPKPKGGDRATVSGAEP